MRIRIVKKPSRLLIIRPAMHQTPHPDKPIAYSIRTLTPLARMTNDMKLKLTDKNGFCDITNNYFDFHRPLYNPVVTKLDAFNKVMDDKLMEVKRANK